MSDDLLEGGGETKSPTGRVWLFVISAAIAAAMLSNRSSVGSSVLCASQSQGLTA